MEINGKNYTLKYSLRSMFVFEEIAGKSFSVDTLLDTYIFLYSCIAANQDNPSIDFNTLIDWCDEHPETMVEFNQFMDSEMKRREAMSKKKVMEEKN